MSANAFEVLGVSPAAGRLLNDSDDRADASRVVVLSYRLWQRQYGGAADSSASPCGSTVESFVVVGVLPAQFPLPLRDVDVVTPLVPDRDPLRHARSSVNFLRIFGRLNAGCRSPVRRRSELTAICRSLRQQFPVEYARKEAVQVGAASRCAGRRLSSVDACPARRRRSWCWPRRWRTSCRWRSSAPTAGASSCRCESPSARRGRSSSRQLTAEASLLAVVGSVLGWLVATQAIAAGDDVGTSFDPSPGEVSLDGDGCAVRDCGGRARDGAPHRCAARRDRAHARRRRTPAGEPRGDRRSLEPSRSECHGRGRDLCGAGPAAGDDRPGPESDRGFRSCTPDSSLTASSRRGYRFRRRIDRPTTCRVSTSGCRIGSPPRRAWSGLASSRSRR